TVTYTMFVDSIIALMQFIFHVTVIVFFFFFSSRRRHTRCYRDWSSDVCSSDLDVTFSSMFVPGTNMEENVTSSSGTTMLRNGSTDRKSVVKGKRLDESVRAISKKKERKQER